MLNSFKHHRKIVSIITKRVHTDNPEIHTHVKYDILNNPTNENLEGFKKEYLPTHWLHQYLPRPDKYLTSGDQMRVFDFDKDVEIGRYAWNSNGCYTNRIANILYRSPALQSKALMNMFIRFAEHRYALDVNKAEEQPRIATNSVFLYRDPSNYYIQRRSAERYLIFMILVQAWNVPTALMYLWVAYYFNLLPKVVRATQSNVYRMDLLPETEQLHIIKVGLFGFPRSVVVNPKDLNKIELDEDTRGTLTYLKTKLWNPREDRVIIYKDQKTGEIFNFNRHGIWNSSGIKHPLLTKE